MKKSLSILLSLLLSFAMVWAEETSFASANKDADTLASNHPEYLPAVSVGADAPEISAPDTTGNVIRLSDYRGKYVILDFWATWCGDCRREMPEFKDLYAELKDRQINGADIEFLSYSFDRDANSWKSYVKKENLSWTQISTIQARWRDIPVTKDYGLNWIPAFLLITPEGKVAGKAITVRGLRQVIESHVSNAQQ